MVGLQRLIANLMHLPMKWRLNHRSESAHDLLLHATHRVAHLNLPLGVGRHLLHLTEEVLHLLHPL